MERITLIGYGEAARAFVSGGLAAKAAYDCDPAKRDGIAAHDRPETPLEGATLVLSLVTADRVLDAARTYAPMLMPGTLWCDLNSVAPATKQAAAAVLGAVGVGYLDVAVMAPVYPALLAVPLVVSGTNANKGAQRLSVAGFTDVRVVGDAVGRASSIKMIRSVMVKGIEALTAEMILAGNAAGVTDEVLASLGSDWTMKADYNLNRMLAHGARRAAEMYEVTQTLEALGISPMMAEATVNWQQAMGELAISPVPDGLTSKLAAIEAIMP